MKTEDISKTYIHAAEAIKTALLQGQYEAAKGVNRIQLATYFAVGKYVSQNSRKGFWGTGALQAISDHLQRMMPGLRGFGATQLREMRLFYEAWYSLDVNSSVTTDEFVNDKKLAENVVITRQSNLSVATDELTQGDLVASNTDLAYGEPSQITIEALSAPGIIDFPIEDFLRVPFTHHSRIIAKVKDSDARIYYITRCAEEHLSVKALMQAIKAEDHIHRDRMPNNFLATMPSAAQARKAVMMFKDEYMLNFINTEQIDERDIADVDERVVENLIIHNVKKFIMTFGKDFAFIGNQYHLEVYSQDFFPDLLFFNRELNAMVVVDLKTGAFKPSYLGQLTTYLRILDDKVRKPHENPTIGIILCKEADKRFVEYVIQDYDKPMGVATYKTTTEMPTALRKTLPDIDGLTELL